MEHNQRRDRYRHTPDLNTLSVLISTVMLAYTLTHFVELPLLSLNLRIFGIFLPLRLNFPILVSLLVAGLVASGTSWMLADHPAIEADSITVEHWLLPGLTSLVLMLVVEQIPFGFLWWIGAALGGLVLMLVLMAEYIAVDAKNRYYPLAEVGITSLSMAFFFMLALLLHSVELRLFFRVPIVSLAAGLVYLRVLHLRTGGQWLFTPALISLLIIGQLSAGLHYWPLNPVSFGIALLGPLYGLIEFGEAYHRAGLDIPLQQIVFSTLIVLISWLIAFLI